MENKPICITDKDGNKRWYNEFGSYHREDGPAVIWKNGNTQWYFNGKCHREDGPAIELVGGTKKWYINDKCHRIDNPAIEWCDGAKSWYLNDKRHRLDGPAYLCYNGEKYWFINECNVTDEITKWAIHNNIDLDNLTDVDKLLIKLTWADYNGK